MQGQFLPGSSPSRIQAYPQDEWHRRESKEADSPWFTQKANKAPDMGLALFTEASGTVSMGRRRRVLSRLGLRSPGKKVNSESLCAPGNQPEKREREKEKEKERKTQGDQALMKLSLQLYFQKELLYLELHISRSKRYKVMQSQLNITSV